MKQIITGIIIILIMAAPAMAAAPARIHTWVNNEILTHSALNAEFDGIITALTDGLKAISIGTLTCGATTFTGALTTQNVIPDGDGTRTLGDVSTYWANLYADAATIATLTVPTSLLAVDLTVTTGSTFPAGDIVYSEMTFSNNIVAGDIAPDAIGASELADNSVASANIIDGAILNADINASAAIADTKLATIATAGKVSNSATTATSANTASAIVARDASGNFSAGAIATSDSITTTLSGNSLGDGVLVNGSTGSIQMFNGTATSGVVAGSLQGYRGQDGAALALIGRMPAANDDANNYGIQLRVTEDPTSATSTADVLRVLNNSTNVMRINAGGNMTLGATDLASTTAKLAVNGLIRTGATTATSSRLGQTLELNAANNYGGISLNTWDDGNHTRSLIDFHKSGSDTPGAYTAVVDDEYLGSFVWFGADGTDWAAAAAIDVAVDGAPGAGDMPSRIEFKTTSDGTESPAVAAIINSSQNTTLGASDLASTTDKLYVDGDATVAGDLDLSDTGYSLGPALRLNRASIAGSPLGAGSIVFDSLDDGANLARYASISSRLIDTSTTSEDGQLNIAVMRSGNGSGVAPVTIASHSSSSSGILTSTFTGNIIVTQAYGNSAPSSASDTGTAGEIRWDANYIYVCTATNTWKRTAISTW